MDNKLWLTSGEERETLFKKKYQNVEWVGSKHSIIKRGQDLIRNRIPGGGQVAVIQGYFALNEALVTGKHFETLLVCLEEIIGAEGWRLLDSVYNNGVPIYVISKKTMALLEEAGGSAGLIGYISLPYHQLESLKNEDGLLIILDGVEIPGNVGTILRSADAVGAKGIVLYRRKVRITHPKLLRASLTAAYRVPIIWEDDFEKLKLFLESRKYNIILADATGGTPYYKTKFPLKTALVLGSEKYGISESFYGLPHERTYLPMLGDMDSLNVGVAATVLMYEAGFYSDRHSK